MPNAETIRNGESSPLIGLVGASLLDVPFGPSPTFFPHVHQIEAWEALDAAAPLRGGLIVLPTGAGKTVTAARWLTEHRLAGPTPRKILWVAHRTALIEQARSAFAASIEVSGRKDGLRLRCISGDHGAKPPVMLEPDDPSRNSRAPDVVFATIGSLAKEGGRESVRRWFERHPGSVLVIDEAHHAAARTYRELLDTARTADPTVEVVGLTATPTRTAQDERGWLLQLFPQGVLHQITIGELVVEGILARPIQRTVDTGISFADGGRDPLTSAEKAYLARWGELGARTLARLGAHVARNQIVIQHYVDHRDEYGKTLVFAADIAHAHTLATQLRDAGVAAEYMAHQTVHGRSDREILRDLRSGALDVVVSVVKLTEGYDIPELQTVFLARPTGSRILLSQMIGRGLRGPGSGGTEHVHLVTFRDHWSDFPDWADPMDVLGIGTAEREGTGAVDVGQLALPWRLLEELAALYAGHGGKNAWTERAPVGWLDLTTATETRMDRILVFDDQMAAYERIEVRGTDVPDARTLAKYFQDLPRASRPSTKQLRALRRYMEETADRPPFVRFDDFDRFDPRRLAQALADGPVSALEQLVHRNGTDPLVVAMFGGPDGYRTALLAELDRFLAGANRVEQVPELRGVGHLRPGAIREWDLAKLAESVRAAHEVVRHLSVPIRWSEDPIDFAWAFYEPPIDRSGDGRIVINSALKTDLVSENTIRFLLYHEMLHAELGAHEGHSADFRRLERQFPGWADADADLDTLLERMR